MAKSSDADEPSADACVSLGDIDTPFFAVLHSIANHRYA